MSRETIPLSDFGVDDTMLAHPPDETLQEHSDLTLAYFDKILNSKDLEPLIDSLIHTIDTKHFELIKEMFVNAIYWHDLGKVNPVFQAKKMQNRHFQDKLDSTQSSDHSPLSSDEYIEYYKPETEKYKRLEKYKLQFVLYSFAYHISKHHGSLSLFEVYRQEEKEVKNYQAYLEALEIPAFEFYILNKLLFSLLISSDYYATTEYMSDDFSIDDFGIFSIEKKVELLEKFQTFISNFGEPKGINKLRNEIFEEAESNLLDNLNKNIFYLEAPTGSGKTITSINLALQLLNQKEQLNKLFYIFPFNTLVEQTKSVFDEIFGEALELQTINSITPIEEQNQEDRESNYTASYVDRLFFHSPAIVTTHVALFNILFGTSKEDNFPLWQLANSVIILDEIQSYNNHLWWYMVEFFDKYAKLLNIKIIIMSATLPKLDYFLEKKDNFIDLITSKKRDTFFTSDYFSKRVEVDFSLLAEGEIELERLEILLDEVRGDYPKILFEFIKKQRAREFYELISPWYEHVYELSGDDNKAYRQFVINQTKEDKSMIIVATQVIEAGVDIDMDLGFKDISTLDSEEQFMGRINRSCKNSGRKVYFFNMDDASDIYRGDNRLGFDLTKPKYQKILEEKNYGAYYEKVLERIQANGLRYESGTTTNIEQFNRLLQQLNYQEVSKTMTLINAQNFTLYFPFQIDLSLYKGVKEFEGLDEIFVSDGKLDGQKVWDAYLELGRIKSFTEQAVKRSYIQSLMQFFTFNIIKFPEQSRPTIGEEIGGYYFVKDTSFIKDEGKFDRKKYQEACSSIFL